MLLFRLQICQNASAQQKLLKFFPFEDGTYFKFCVSSFLKSRDCLGFELEKELNCVE